MNANQEFSHIVDGQPAMVDVSHKPNCLRMARALSRIRLPISVTDRLQDKELTTKKGPVFKTAIIAGTMAVKNTASLIPFCHPLIIDHVGITIMVEMPGLIRIECVVKTFGRTGVEMEALTGASMAALTVYDMCKSLTRDMNIETTLLEKTGGKSDQPRLP